MKLAKLFFVGVVASLTLASCDESEEFRHQSEIVTDIIVTGEDIVPELGDATRTSYTMESSLKFYWSSGDTLGIYPIGGTQVDFPISSGEGSNSAAFDGGAWALRSTYSYAAYYPFTSKNFHIKEDAIPVNYSGQEQNGNGSLEHLGKYDFMAAAATSPNEVGGVNLAMKHLGSFIRLQLTMPVADTYKSVTLSCDDEKFTTEATYDLTAAAPVLTPKSKSSSYEIKLKNTSTTENKELLTVYAFVGPTDLSGKELTITVAGTTNQTYVGTVDGKNMKARGGYNYALEFKSGTNASGDDISFDEDNGVVLAESAELLSGRDFNKAIKQLVDPSAYYWWGDEDKTITKIIFRKGYSAEGTVVSSPTSRGEVRAVYNVETRDVDIYVAANKLVFSESCACMFCRFTSVTQIDWSSFGKNIDTSNVTDMYNMFEGCSSLTALDVSNFDTSNVKDLRCMFDGCSALTSLDVSNFDISNVTDIYRMFCGCSSLTALDVSNFDTSNATDMNLMFYRCSALTTLDVSTFDTSNVTDLRTMFYECSALTSLDVSSFDTSNVTDMRSMFQYCTSLTSLDVSNFNTSNVTDMRSMFYGCSNHTSIDLFFDTSKVTNVESMFCMCQSLSSINLSTFDTSNVTSMWDMFRGCESLASLDLSNFNTTNVNNMWRTFSDCYNLSSLNLSKFDVSNVTDLTDMFVWMSRYESSCTITCTSATQTKLRDSATGIDEEKIRWDIIEI